MRTKQKFVIFLIIVVCSIVSSTHLKKLFAENASVSITVPPHSSDFQTTITASPTTTVNQSQTITYTITYGANLYYTDQLKVEAEWNQGTISEASSPSVEGLDYVIGSATKAYNNTSAVVDLINNKISWTMPSFPAQTTNRTVSFQLKTNASYTGTSIVTFPIKVHLTVPNFTTDNQIVNTTYLYDNTITPTPTPVITITSTPTIKVSTTPIISPTLTQVGKLTPTPTIIPTLTLSPTPTTPPIPDAPKFMQLSVRGITSDTIKLTANTSIPTKISVSYGTSQNSLSLSQTDNGISTNHDLSLDNLLASTTYYVQAKAMATNGLSLTSEIFSFTTAAPGAQPEVNRNSVTFVSSDVVLYVGKPTKEGEAPPKPAIIVPQQTTYNFRFQVEKPKTIKKVQAILRNKNVLGIGIGPGKAFAEEPNTTITDLIETQEGIYEGRLETPNIPGTYEEYARMYDTNGNIVEQKLADVTVSQPLRVYNMRNQQPIENAQILLSYYNEHARSYLPLPPQLFPVKNPGYTTLNGQLILALPQGKYQAKITAIGYKEKQIAFVLGDATQQDYPKILLTEEPFNFFTTIHYYWNILNDVASTTQTYVQGLAYSIRFFELNALISISILVFLTLLSFSNRIHIPLRFLASYFFHFAKISAIQRKIGDTIKGRIFDKDTGKEVAHALVYLINNQKTTILSHTTSDTSGNFIFSNSPTTGYDIQIMADGYEPTIFHESDIHAIGLGGYLLSIKRKETAPSLFEQLTVFFGKLLDVGFETLLILSLISELALGSVLGWEKTLVFFVISCMNLFLWLIHLSHFRGGKNIF